MSPPAMALAMMPTAAPVDVLRLRCLLGNLIESVNVCVDGSARISRTEHHRDSKNCYPQYRPHYVDSSIGGAALTPGATITIAISCFSIRICEVARFRCSCAIALRLHFRMLTYAFTDIKPIISSGAIRAISDRGRNPGDVDSNSGGRRNNRLYRMGRRHTSKSRNRIPKAGRGENSLCASAQQVCDGARHAPSVNGVCKNDARAGDGPRWRWRHSQAMPTRRPR